MALSRTSLLAIGGLAGWLLLASMPWPGLTEQGRMSFGLATPIPGSLMGLPLWFLLALRVAVAVVRDRPAHRWLRLVARVGWVLVASGYGLLIGARIAMLSQYTAALLWMPSAAFLALTTALGAVAGVLTWWVADRLDALGADGAFVLLVPPAAVLAIDWHIDTINHAFVGIISPWRALQSPILPLVLVLAALTVRPPRLGGAVIGGWGPRTVLPFLLLPFALDQAVPHGCPMGSTRWDAGWAWQLPWDCSPAPPPARARPAGPCWGWG